MAFIGLPWPTKSTGIFLLVILAPDGCIFILH
jgi:hypothetical protein